MPYDMKKDLPTLLTTINTKYNVYSSTGTLKYENVVSLFDAIGKASVLNDYVKETDSSLIVFKKDNSTSTFYKFQFTKFCGTTDLTGANTHYKIKQPWGHY